MSVIGKGKKNNSQDTYPYLHSAEKGQLPSPDETVNPLDLKKVERVACRVSVQGGVSERVKWVKFLYIFVHLQLKKIDVLSAKVQRNFVLQKRPAKRAGQGGDQRGNKRGSAEEGWHERQVGEKLRS